MPSTGYQRIIDLYNGAADPIGPETTDVEAVEFLQEIIRCHALRKVPGRKNHTVPAYTGGELFGTYGKFTKSAVDYFKDKYNKAHPDAKLPSATPTTTVDRETLQALVQWSANHQTPGAGRLYLDKVLGRADSIWDKMASLISTHEESVNGGGLTAVSDKSQTWLDANGDGQCDKGPCDQAGLSYGIIQVTHGSGRLATLMKAFQAAHENLFNQTFKVPGTTIAGLLDHLDNFAAQTTHGIANAPTYDLYSTSWTNRFLAAGRLVEFQKIQLDNAVAALKESYRLMKQAPDAYAPELVNERGIGFWLDVTNQTGDPVAKNIYAKAKEKLTAAGKPVNQENILNQIVDQSSFKDRRKYFRDHAPLNSANDPFA